MCSPFPPFFRHAFSYLKTGQSDSSVDNRSRSTVSMKYSYARLFRSTCIIDASLITDIIFLSILANNFGMIEKRGTVRAVLGSFQTSLYSDRAHLDWVSHLLYFIGSRQLGVDRSRGGNCRRHLVFGDAAYESSRRRLKREHVRGSRFLLSVRIFGYTT